MAEISPFRALHYDASRVGALDKLVTQPYDKITPEMQARYYELSPYNLARIIRGRESPFDAPADNVYSRAARDFHHWIQNRVLVSDTEPALYPYFQEYSVPGEGGRRRERRGLIALGRLEDYSTGVIHRHEETLSGPKADRFELLTATRAHFGQIFMLYSDPAGAVEEGFACCVKESPWQRVLDEYGTLHSVWRIAESSTIGSLAGVMRDKKLVIADGHHRYETALAYRDYCRAQGHRDERAEYVMMTFVRMETEGLTILPTHRVVHSLPSFDWDRFLAEARPIFDVEEPTAAIQPQAGADREASLRRLKAGLAEADQRSPTFGVYGGPGKIALLRLRRDQDPVSALPDVPASLARLDVVVLHRIVLERVLGIDSQAVREEKNLRYVREAGDAFQQVDSGQAQLCFLVNPTPVEAVRDNAFAGLVLPQKSTDFYPKLLSGLTVYWLDNPAGI